MTPTEIIRADAEKRGVDPEGILQYVASLVEQKKCFIMRVDNSLLFIILIAPQEAELHLATVDTPLKLTRAFIQFKEGLQKSGLKKIYIDASIPDQLTRLLEFVKWDLQPSDNPKYKYMEVLS